MTIRAVAWDIDGTLIDSERLHHEALVEVCDRLGANLRDLPDLAFRGVHMHDVWVALRGRLPPGLHEHEWLAAIERLYIAGAPQLAPIAGALEVVRRLSELGVRQVCVSNSRRAVVDANIATLDVGEHMAFSISLDDVAHGKPHPEPYQLAARRLGVSCRQMLAVEDSLSGVRSAHAAGARVAGLLTEAAADDLIAWRLERLQEALDIVLASGHRAAGTSRTRPL